MQKHQFTVFLALLFGACTLALPHAQAQRSDPYYPRFIIVNGGLFGGSDYANVGVYNGSNNTFWSIDTVRVNSVQDLHIEQYNNTASAGQHIGYLAAQDSIIKYDFLIGQRLGAVAFGGVLTSRLRTSGDYLLVGNTYGSTNNNLRIFDKNTLAYIDSVPEIAHGVKDIVVVGDTAFIVQNLNDFSTNFVDSLGYISAVRVSTQEWLYNDTLNANGYEVGRMVRLHPDSDTLVSVNAVSNTISYYNWRTRQSSTVAPASGVVLQNLQAGNSMYPYTDFFGSMVGAYYMPFNDAIGRYDLATNTVVEDSFIVHGQTTPFVQGFAFTIESQQQNFFLTKIDFVNQANNIGVIYNAQGDSTGTFPVGFSPEILHWTYFISTSVERQSAPQTPILSAFPNPTRDGFQTLRAQASERERTLLVVDALGREVQRTAWAAGIEQMPIDLSTLAAGTYWLQLREDSQRAERSWLRVQKL